MKKLNWHPIEEMDLEDGAHTCYAAELDVHHFVFTTQTADDRWDVELKRKGEDGYTTLVSCKSLTSARRWAARYL